MTQNRHRKLTRAQTEEALKTVKIVDKEEAFWNGAIERTKVQIGHLEEELKIANMILEGAQRKLEEAKAKNQPVETKTDDSHEHKE